MVHKRAARRARRAKRKSPLLIRLALAPSVFLGNLATKLFFPKVKTRQTTKELAKTTGGRVLGGAILGTSALLGLALAPGGIGRGLATLIPKTPFGRATTLGLAGLATASPTVAKAVFETPRVIFEKTEEIGEKIEALPKDITEGKGVLGLVAAALAGGGLVAAASQVPKIFGAAKETLDLIPKSPSGIGSELPVTPQTEVIEAGTPETKPKQRRKTRRKVPSVRVSQRVNVIVQQNKNFLNRGIVVT